jgi:hypothetical protein
MDALANAHEFFVRANGADADVKACGPGTPTLVSSSRDDLAGDGSKKARFPGRARYKR